jgi:hypothetical protein
MAHIGLSGTTVILTSPKPASDGRDGTIADKGDRFLIHLPFGVELLRRHPKLAVTVEVD